MLRSKCSANTKALMTLYTFARCLQTLGQRIKERSDVFIQDNCSAYIRLDKLSEHNIINTNTYSTNLPLIVPKKYQLCHANKI